LIPGSDLPHGGSRSVGFGLNLPKIAAYIHPGF
jgi:hypothetical protein